MQFSSIVIHSSSSDSVSLPAAGAGVGLADFFAVNGRALGGGGSSTALGGVFSDARASFCWEEPE